MSYILYSFNTLHTDKCTNQWGFSNNEGKYRAEWIKCVHLEWQGNHAVKSTFITFHKEIEIYIIVLEGCCTIEGLSIVRNH